MLPMLLLASALLVQSAYADSPSPVLGEKDIRRGESIVAQFRILEGLTNPQAYRSAVNKIYPAMFLKVSELKEGDLKTDLTTAAFLYEQAAGESENPASVDCGQELRSLYSKVCEESRVDTVLHLLLAKARLHTYWAESLIKYQRGARDGATVTAVEEMRREREGDVALARKAVAALRTLEKDVYAYASLTEFQEHGDLSKIPYERLSANASSVLRFLDRVLQSLPRGPLFYPLYNARNSYANGLFWWQKTYARSRMVVEVNSLKAADQAGLLGLDPVAVNYTVVINWRNAVRRTRQAEALIEGSRLKG